jgi:lipopolysaccharide export system protein LptA
VTAHLRFLRRVSIVLLLVWVGVVAASFLRRQSGRTAPTGQVQFENGGESGGEQPVRVHRGFVYTDTVGVEPNFRVAAQETVEFASGWFELREVEVSVYHGPDVVYALTSQRARLNRDRREAIATGDVRLSLAGGVAVSAAGFSLKGEERVLESQGPATFAGDAMGGLAGGITCNLTENSIALNGGVSFVWRPSGGDASPLIVLAPRATYTRSDAIVDFPEGATFLRGSLRLQGAAVQVQLREAEGGIQAITLAEPIEMAGTTAQNQTLSGRAGKTELQALDDGRLRFTAEPASDCGWVSLRLRDPIQGWRELNAWRLVGEGSRDAWEWLEAQGLACLTDFPASAEVRELGSESIRLEFADGQARSAVAAGNVRLESAGQWAEGERLVFSLASQSFSLSPAPARRVAVGTGEVTCVCDALESASGGSVTARGNVSGVLRRAALWGASDAPMRFAADSALVASSGARLDLDGQARLWQGDRLVRADRIEFERARELLSASGNVVTLARMTPRGSGPGELMQLRARSLQYEHGGGLAVYEGDVVLEDPRSMAKCQRLTVTMGSDGQVLLATLEGGVTVTEQATTRVIKGQGARVDSTKNLLELWGTPLLIQEASGSQVKGSRLEWRRDTESMVVFGADGAPTETIYQAAAPGATPGATPPTARKR